MNPFRAPFLFTALTILAATSLNAEPDRRARAALDESGYAYSTTDSGSFKIPFSGTNGESVDVFVNSTTKSFRHLPEMREVWGFVMLPDRLSLEQAEDLLARNNKYKFGRFALVTLNDGSQAVTYAVDIPADTDGNVLESAVQLVRGEVEERRAELVSGSSESGSKPAIKSAKSKRSSSSGDSASSFGAGQAFSNRKSDRVFGYGIWLIAFTDDGDGMVVSDSARRHVIGIPFGSNGWFRSRGINGDGIHWSVGTRSDSGGNLSLAEERAITFIQNNEDQRFDNALAVGDGLAAGKWSVSVEADGIRISYDDQTIFLNKDEAKGTHVGRKLEF